MKISALIENTVFSKGFEAEHGLSLLAQFNGQNLLIDCGQSEAFLRNMRRMKTGLAEISAAVITHGHYDHTGGLFALSELAPDMPIYLSQQATDPKFRDGIAVGMPNKIAAGKYISINEPTVQLSEEVFIISNIKRYFPIDIATAGFNTEHNGAVQQDEFDDELAIAIKYPGGLAVISGCSHNGATNIIETVQERLGQPVTAFIGGLHLQDKTSGDKFDHLVEYINRSSLRHIITCHCTGIHAFAELRARCNIRVDYLSTGKTIELAEN